MSLRENTSPGNEPELENVMSELSEYQLELLRYFTYWDDLLYNSASAVAG